MDIFEKFVKSKLILGIETKATLEVKDEKEIVTEAERYASFLIFLETLLRLPFYQKIRNEISQDCKKNLFVRPIFYGLFCNALKVAFSRKVRCSSKKCTSLSREF